MNKRQREVLKEVLMDEEDVLNELKKNYEEALKRIDDEIARLIGTTGELSSSQVYQIQFQEYLKSQIEKAYANLSGDNTELIREYMKNQYQNGFVGSQYVMNGQGVPFAIKLDEEAMKQAIMTTNNGFKLSEKLYSNTELLKNNVRNEITRGIATGSSYSDIARNLMNVSMIDFNKAVRIARTEGGRMQSIAKNNAMKEAKKRGANIVKKWDATLDSRTRESHQMVDGEVREMDEPFSNGLMFPRDPNGSASEVINCRCQVLEKARWGLDDDILKFDSELNDTVIIKAKDYDDYKKKFFENVNKK